MTPVDWVRDHADSLRVANHVCTSTLDNSVTAYGQPGTLALIRMSLDAKSCDDGRRVRTWTAELDGGMSVVLLEVGDTGATS